jgi:hypothetical protein
MLTMLLPIKREWGFCLKFRRKNTSRVKGKRETLIFSGNLHKIIEGNRLFGI